MFLTDILLVLSTDKVSVLEPLAGGSPLHVFLVAQSLRILGSHVEPGELLGQSLEISGKSREEGGGRRCLYRLKFLARGG